MDTFPPDPFDTGIDHTLVMIMVVLFWGYLVVLLARYLQRRRPGLSISGPIAVGYGLRVAAMAAVSATGIGLSLRGGDEITFMHFAHIIAGSSLTSGNWLPFNGNGLYEIVFALQLKVGEFSIAAMRITDIGIAMVGIVLLVVSVHDLAGPRAARWAAWILAIEPVSIFFSEVLHKEPFMTLASGLVVFGCTKIWDRLNPSGVLLVAAGGAIAVATRPYAGWFLVAGAIFVATHASIRRLRESGRAIAMLLAVAGIVAVSAPIIVKASTSKNLQSLQQSQNANTSAAGSPSNNLALEQVDYSTRSAIISNLPKRIRDLIIKPFPWQLGNTSQAIGAVGTLIAYLVFFLLFLYAFRLRGQFVTATAPILYPALLVTVAYSLSVGNAGTGFRYRSHLVILAVCGLAVVRARWQTAEARGKRRTTQPAWPSSSGGALAGSNA